MQKTDDCSLTQLAIEAVIKAFGIRCANKKAHRDIREQAVRDIVCTLKWYKAMCDHTDRKGVNYGR